MIDIHCHLLPGIDDGAQTLPSSLEMARIAVADGITTIFCTPHIYPGLYENHGPDIRRRVDDLQKILRDHGIALELSFGADTHLVPEVRDGLRTGRIPTLGGSRYLLLEPSHHVRPPRFRESVFELIGAGYVPVITHPERLTWVEQHYADFTDLARSGAWMQVTGGALVGRFGPRVKKIAERFVGDGWTHVLASDGHTTGQRSPVLAAARARAESLLGRAEANRLVLDRPYAVLRNVSAGQITMPPAMLLRSDSTNAGKMMRWLPNWFRR
jgi:protein-tyrosine phosphatase